MPKVYYTCTHAREFNVTFAGLFISRPSISLFASLLVLGNESGSVALSRRKREEAEIEGQRVEAVAAPIHVEELRGQTVAVDAYSWIHKGAFFYSTQLCKGLPTSKYQCFPFRLQQSLLFSQFFFYVGRKIVLFCFLLRFCF